MGDETIQSVEQAQAAAAGAARPYYDFIIPAAMGGETLAIRLTEITTGEEIMATKRARQDPILLSFELAKESVRGVKRLNPGQARPDDETIKKMPWVKVSTGDGSAEAAYSDMHPKIRQLVLTAYTKIHNAVPQEQADFLASMEVTI